MKNSVAKRSAHLLTTKRRHSAAGYFYCLPLIIGIAFLFIPSLIQTVIYTFNSFDINPLGAGYSLIGVGLKNYKKAFGDPQFLISLKSSLENLLINLPIIVIFSLFIAVILNQNFKGKITMRVIFFIPVLLATGVVASIESTSNLMGMVADTVIDTGDSVDWSQMAGLKNVLLSMNLSDSLIKIVANAAERIYEIVQASGVQIFILLAALQEISPALYEAAKVEGCDNWSIFWKITFPMVSPQLVLCGVYTVLDSYSSISNSAVKYIDSVSYSPNQYGFATAMSLIYFLAVGIILAIVGSIVSRYVYNGEN